MPVGPRVHRQLLVARARMSGLLVHDYADRFDEAVDNLTGWLDSGELVSREHVLDGIEAGPQGCRYALSRRKHRQAGDPSGERLSPDIYDDHQNLKHVQQGCKDIAHHPLDLFRIAYAERHQNSQMPMATRTIAR